MRPMRVLIAGCGDLGMRTAALLSAQAGVDAVFGLKRRPPAGNEHAIQWVSADLADPATLASLPDGITHVLYCPTPSGRDEQAYREVFVDGLRHLLAGPAFGTVQRMVFVSSSAVYGDHQGDWIDEETPTHPQGFNGRILLQAESLSHSWGAQADGSGPEVKGSSCVLRLAGIYGPGRTQLLDRLRQGQARAPVEPPHWANRIHVDDAARACMTLLMKEAVAPCYLGCDDTPLPLRDLYVALARRIGAPEVPVGPGPANVGSKRMRNARLRATGWIPAHPDAREGYFAP